MMLVKSSSTGKSKAKRSQLARMTECSTCPKLLPTMHKKDHERPQPIKIAQLLGQSENLKSTQKESVCKKVQPERLGTFSTTKRTRVNEKQSGTSMSVKSIHPNKCVRRILNFGGVSVNALKDNDGNKNKLNKFVTVEPSRKSVSKPARKKSLLLPPNSIKDKHLQKCVEKVNEVSKEMDETNINSTVKKGDKIMNESFNTNINSAVSFDSRETCNEQEIVQSSNYSKSKTTDANYTQQFKISRVTPKFSSPSQCKTSQQVTTKNKDQLFVQSNSKIMRNNGQNDILVKSEEAGDCIQNLCNDLQDTKLVPSENDTNVEHEFSKMIYVSRDEIICLERDLKDLLKETEKNIIKLKSALTCTARLLSIDNKKITTSNTVLKKENSTMIDKDNRVETCYKPLQYLEEQLKTPVTHTPRNILTNIELLKKDVLTQIDEDNKENNESLNIRRISDIAADGSFLELENQLNIMHAKPTQNYTIQPKTPIITKYKQKRSFKEYMALKSSITFLETPDGKKFRSVCQIDNIDNTDKSVLNVTYISNKLLTDLHNLYSESPES